MAEFIINQEVKTDTPPWKSRCPPTSPCRLAVTPSAWWWSTIPGNTSIPDEVIVIVADAENPTAVLNARAAWASARASTSTAASPSTRAAEGGDPRTYMGQP